MDPDDNRKMSRKYKKARREYLQNNDEEESRVVAGTSSLALEPGFEAVSVDIGIHSVQPTPQFHGSAPVSGGSSDRFSSPQQPQSIQGTIGAVTPQFGSGKEELDVPEVCEAVPHTNVGMNEEFCGFSEPVYEENDFDGNSEEASRFAIDFAEDFELSAFTDVVEETI
ncbi:hypothetical protein ONE63_011091 [Megalurothrips usitatus]|uniref:Uncharacterized protein n=1 Tax=Megalurothrips usitatus TaxID=439358 RepID=A0AAV7XF13_9NEOP|nr:hypothetical protein ONE63_011091 [Megalurothrips usitatus]